MDLTLNSGRIIVFNVRVLNLNAVQLGSSEGFLKLLLHFVSGGSKYMYNWSFDVLDVKKNVDKRSVFHKIFC